MTASRCRSIIVPCEPRVSFLDECRHTLGDVVGGCDLLDEQRFEGEGCISSVVGREVQQLFGGCVRV